MPRPSPAGGGDAYPALVTRLLRDLPELLAFFHCPRALWRKLRTTNVIERCFVEVRRRTRPMVCFVNVQSVERIIFSIFNRFNLEWRQRTLRQFTHVAVHHQTRCLLLAFSAYGTLRERCPASVVVEIPRRYEHLPHLAFIYPHRIKGLHAAAGMDRGGGLSWARPARFSRLRVDRRPIYSRLPSRIWTRPGTM